MALRPELRLGTALRGAAVAVAAGRMARGARREAPRRAAGNATVDRAAVTVIIPARNEAERIGPALDSLVAQGADVIVIDDNSTDATRAVATAAGAVVVDAGPLPDGWAGKAHALQVGLQTATTPLVIAVDADCRAEPGFVAALAEAMATTRSGTRPMLLTAGAAVDNPNPMGRAVHASMLATLVYRLGPPGVPARRPSHTMANGQCMVFDRVAVLDAGGFGPVADQLIEDVALARHLAHAGHPVWFADATHLLRVDGYGSARSTLAGWGRSLALAEVTTPAWLVADLAVVWMAMASPLPRILAGRGDAVDWAGLALRLGITAATAGAFTRRGPAIWAAPLLDVPTAVALTVGAVRPSRTWRGRTYA